MVNSAWNVRVLDAAGSLLGFVGGWSRLRAQLRGRRGGTWELSGSSTSSSGLDKFTPGTRMLAQYGDIIVAGYVTSITSDTSERDRTVTVSGITDTGLLAHRLTLPSPERAFNAQDQSAYWAEHGPAGFLIHRLVCRNAGMGAQGPRQMIDSRVGTEVRGNPGNGAIGWTNTSDAGVTWAGQVATIPAGSSARLRTTDAIDLSTTDMATAAANVTVNGSCTLAVTAYFNDTAVGAAPGQAGAVTELSTIHAAANVSASTLWVAEAFRTRNIGPPTKQFCRLEVGVQASGAQRTATFNAGGGVWTQAMVGGTARLNTRFESIAEVVEQIAIQGDVYLTADTAYGLPRLVVRGGVDKSDSVRLSTSIGNVSAHSTSLAAPKGNVVLVAGGGEGTARTLRSEVDTVSLAEWGLRIEGFRDARDTTDTATLDARADEWIVENAATGGLKVQAVDVVGMTYASDYELGDRVSVVLDGVTTVQPVTSVEIVADADGTKVRPVVGSAELGEDAPGLYAVVRDLRRRIAQLERRF